MKQKTRIKKSNLSNLSNDGQRMERAILARKKLNKPFDRKGYNDAYSKKVKTTKNFWEGWFKMEYRDDEKR